MLSKPTSFPYGNIFGYRHWLDNVYYQRKTVKSFCTPCNEVDKNEVIRERSSCCYTVIGGLITGEAGTADLSAKKIVFIKGNQITDTPSEGATKEIWVPIYRKKANGDATIISFTCVIFVPFLIPFSVAYNVLRLVRIPFLLLYHIGKAVYDILARMKSNDPRTALQIIWDHTVEFFDQTFSSLVAIVDNLFWRISSWFGHLIGFFEGLGVANPRVGRKWVAWSECKANREISLLRQFKSEYGKKLDALSLNRSEGVSLHHSWWSVAGAGSKFSFLSQYHAFVVAGCFFPMAVGVLDENGENVVNVRSDTGEMLDSNVITTNQKSYSACGCLSNR